MERKGRQTYSRKNKGDNMTKSPNLPFPTQLLRAPILLNLSFEGPSSLKDAVDPSFLDRS